MVARAARRTIFRKNPELGKKIPLLTLGKDELTREYVWKLLETLKRVGAPTQYRVLAEVVDEDWRFPPKKVERSSAEKKDVSRPTVEAKEDTAEKKEEPTVEVKDVKLKDLKLNAKALKVLEDGHFVTLQDVKKVGIGKVANIKGIGPTTVKRLTEELVKIA